MLLYLGIQNFTTVESLELDFATGLTTITGETGAGKSVILDALGQALGDRSTLSVLRDESRNAEINAGFMVDRDSEIAHWLEEKDLPGEATGDGAGKSDGMEVILRRVITPAGRTRCYINGGNVNVADLRYLGQQLVDLHGQHEHQSLLDRSTHRKVLDAYAGNSKLLAKTAELAGEWQHLDGQIKTLQKDSAERSASWQLLNYQVQELDKLAPLEGEVTRLETEQRQLANATGLLQSCSEAASLCDNDEATAALSQLQRAVQLLLPQAENLPQLKESVTLLQSACIQVQEASHEINSQLDSVTVDPERLRQVEDRLDQLYSVARKHNVDPQQLPDTLQQFSVKLKNLEDADGNIEQMQAQQQQLASQYAAIAKKLSAARHSSAKKMVTAINKKLAELKMTHCAFEVKIDKTDGAALHASGNDQVDFLISTVPGKPAQALSKIASGGELSRISLAIQVVASQLSTTPTLVFDEVDVGIGGAVAEVVGNLLRELSRNNQILCVTHLPQVAVKGHTHLLVSKTVSKTSATTSITALNKEERTRELARMLGGLDLTESTIAHAADMLESA